MPVVPFQDFAVDASKDKPWRSTSARRRIRRWVSPKDDPSEWSRSEWAKFRTAHLWYDTATSGSLGGYYFPVVDIMDGTPRYNFRAVAASLAIARGARGAGENSVWWADRGKLESHIASIYKKFGEEMPSSGKSLAGMGITEEEALAMSIPHRGDRSKVTLAEGYLELKATDDDSYPNGILEGKASVFDVLDLNGDVVKKGAFKKTIKEQKQKVPMLDSHRAFGGVSSVIGRTLELREEDDHLYFKAFFSGAAGAQEIRTKIKEGLIKGVSIGYNVIKDHMLASGVRELLEVKLWEISVVVFPANPLATITGAKGITEGFEFLPCADLQRPFDADVAFRRWTQFCGKGKPFRDWDDEALDLFSKGFLLNDPDAAQRDDMFRHLVVDVIDGKPLVVKSAVTMVAAEDEVDPETTESLLTMFKKFEEEPETQPVTTEIPIGDPEETTATDEPVEEQLPPAATPSDSGEPHSPPLVASQALERLQAHKLLRSVEQARAWLQKRQAGGGGAASVEQ